MSTSPVRDDRALARWRMRSLRLAGEPFGTAPEVVSGLLAVQAENYAQASWAVAARTAGEVTEADLGALFARGAFLRTHVLRTTWHFVAPDDIRWLVALTAPRIRPTMRQVRQATALDEATLDRSLEVVCRSLAGGTHLTRAAVGERLRDEGLPSAGRSLGVVMFHAETAGVVCSGVPDGKDQTYALLEERARGGRRLGRDEALAELALRYVGGHGPVTERDLAYWATMTLADVRTGLAAVGDRLGSFVHDGRTYWHVGDPPPDGPGEPRGHLLQALDEYHNGVQDSRHVLDAEGIMTTGRAATVGMALVDGQAVGGMRRTVRAPGVVFDVHPYRELTGDEVSALQEAASRYGAFVGLEASLAVAGVAHS